MKRGTNTMARWSAMMMALLVAMNLAACKGRTEKPVSPEPPAAQPAGQEPGAAPVPPAESPGPGEPAAGTETAAPSPATIEAVEIELADVGTELVALATELGEMRNKLLAGDPVLKHLQEMLVGLRGQLAATPVEFDEKPLREAMDRAVEAHEAARAAVKEFESHLVNHANRDTRSPTCAYCNPPAGDERTADDLREALRQDELDKARARADANRAFSRARLTARADDPEVQRIEQEIRKLQDQQQQQLKKNEEWKTKMNAYERLSDRRTVLLERRTSMQAGDTTRSEP